MGDYGCMLRAYRRPIIDTMLRCHERSTFIPILANIFARRATEIPVHHAEREFGDSKYSFMRLINLMYDTVTCLTTTPLRLLSLLAALSPSAGLACRYCLLYFARRWDRSGRRKAYLCSLPFCLPSSARNSSVWGCWANTSVAFITMSAPAPAILFSKLSTRKARRLLRKVTNESRYFAYHDMGCQGVQAVLDAGYEIAAIFTHADNPAENTFWLRLPAGGRIRDSGLCAG